MSGAHEIPWDWIYAEGSLASAASRFTSEPRTSRTVLAGIRGLAAHLGQAIDIPDTLHPEVGPVAPPPALVHLLAAAGDEGLLGHIARRLEDQDPEKHAFLAGADRIEDAESLVDAVLRAVSPLLPDPARPQLEYVIAREASGDSHALSAGLSAIAQLMHADTQPGIAATGGWDRGRRCFCPVPGGTIAAKLDAAARWGIRRVLVVEGQELPEERPVEVIAIPSDPAALPLVAVQHVIQGADASKVREALGIYDIRVARASATSLERILEFTEQFIDPAVCSDDILRQMAADMRSRAYLHRGRSEEAGQWLKTALELRGRSFLPDGLVGDYLLYQQAAHHSITQVDHGVLEDPPEGPPVHAEVDRLIDELSERWCTRHQALCRIFLRNTRARRLEYLARFTLDPSLLKTAQDDLLAESDQWEPLIHDYARNTLHMGATDLRRMHNQLIDLAVTEAFLADPEGYDSIDWRPRPTAFARVIAPLVWTASLREVPGDASPFDLVGLVKWWWLWGEVDGQMLDSGLAALGEGCGFPHTLAAEFLLRLGCREARANLEQALVAERASGSILSVLALRTAKVLGEELDRVPPPIEGGSLRRFFDDLRGDEGTLVARCPY